MKIHTIKCIDHPLKVKPSDPQWQMSYLLYPSIFDNLTDTALDRKLV